MCLHVCGNQRIGSLQRSTLSVKMLKVNPNVVAFGGDKIPKHTNVYCGCRGSRLCREQCVASIKRISCVLVFTRSCLIRIMFKELWQMLNPPHTRHPSNHLTKIKRDEMKSLIIVSVFSG